MFRRASESAFIARRTQSPSAAHWLSIAGFVAGLLFCHSARASGYEWLDRAATLTVAAEVITPDVGLEIEENGPHLLLTWPISVLLPLHGPQSREAPQPFWLDAIGEVQWADADVRGLSGGRFYLPLGHGDEPVTTGVELAGVAGTDFMGGSAGAFIYAQASPHMTLMGVTYRYAFGPHSARHQVIFDVVRFIF